MIFKEVIRKIIIAIVYGRNKVSREKYVSYLKKIGVRVGNNLYITDPINCELDLTRPWLLEIGNDVCITDNVRILTHDFSYSVVSLSSLGTYPSCGKVKIGNNVFIGSHALILPNIKIGDNVVIGAGSIVTKDIPNDCVVAGVPAKILSSLEKYKNKLNVNMIHSLRELIDEYEKVFGCTPPETIMTEFYGLYMTYDEIAKRYPNYLKRLIRDKKMVKPIYSSYEEMIVANKKNRKG